MRLTANRKLILRLLNGPLPDCGFPPYSSDDLHWAIHVNHMATYFAEQDGTESPKTLPSIQQIQRTLNDLANQGLITVEYRLNPDTSNPLPQWVSYWQRVDYIERNKLIAACHEIYAKASRVKFGINLFGVIVDQGLSADAVTALQADIESLIEQTQDGFEDERAMLFEALGWVIQQSN